MASAIWKRPENRFSSTEFRRNAPLQTLDLHPRKTSDFQDCQGTNTHVLLQATPFVAICCRSDRKPKSFPSPPFSDRGGVCERSGV